MTNTSQYGVFLGWCGCSGKEILIIKHAYNSQSGMDPVHQGRKHHVHVRAHAMQCCIWPLVPLRAFFTCLVLFIPAFLYTGCLNAICNCFDRISHRLQSVCADGCTMQMKTIRFSTTCSWIRVSISFQSRVVRGQRWALKCNIPTRLAIEPFSSLAYIEAGSIWTLVFPPKWLGGSWQCTYITHL